MFITGFVTRIKCAFRDKEMIFWTLLFPVMLATLFYFCFSNLDSADAFSPVKTAVVADQAYRQAAGFQAALEEVSKEGEDRLLQLTQVETREEADRLLEDGRVEGYLTIEDGAPKLTVRDDGLNQTILKSFLDLYLQISATAAHILERNPQAAQQGLLTDLMGQQEFTREISLSNAKPSHQLPYFYALIAMVCLYGSFQGLTSAFYLQANLSALGARRSMAPRKKLAMITADMLGSLAVHLLTMLVLLCYLLLVLRLDFGNQIGYLLLTVLVGSIVGVSLGALVGAALRIKVEAKTAILITLSLACCFLAGLMVEGISYAIQQNAPAAAWLNPAARISDAFYCLYYYDNHTRYFMDLGVLCAMAAIFGLGAMACLRRRKYESI